MEGRSNIPNRLKVLDWYRVVCSNNIGKVGENHRLMSGAEALPNLQVGRIKRA